MKHQLKFMMLLIGASIITFTGCEKDRPHFTKTSFTLTTTERIKAGSYIGYFTSTGDPTTAGTWTMQSTVVPPDSLYCSQTLTVPGKGTITALTDCSLINNTGVWHITDGTGAYANLRGNGTLLMLNITQPNSSEEWKGNTWRE